MAVGFGLVALGLFVGISTLCRGFGRLDALAAIWGFAALGIAFAGNLDAGWELGDCKVPAAGCGFEAPEVLVIGCERVS